MEMIEILDYIEENDIRFLRLQFTDIDGQNRNIAISPFEFERVLSDGLMFSSSEIPGFESCAEEDLVLKPIVDSVTLLPWRPQEGSVAKMNCHICLPDGSSFAGDSREILKRVQNRAKKDGITFEIGVKIEFYLFELNEDGSPSKKPVDHAGFFDLAPMDRGENTRREIILTLEDMGFSIKSSHHESGAGQHEIDFNAADPLTLADNIQTFKTVVKTIANLNGMHASFMPKPLNGQPGNGMHMLISARQYQKDLFRDEEKLLSDTAKAFCGGIYRRLPEMIAFTNPIVNSYKRLAGGFVAPADQRWRPQEKEAIIRIPKKQSGATSLILRSPDPACNPYLALALVLAAGLEGMDEGLDPENYQYESLPHTIHEAVKLTKDSEFVESVLGEMVHQIFVHRKEQEWCDYLSTVHDWEYAHYFERV